MKNNEIEKMDVLYLRVSSEEQRERHTIRSQRDPLDRYCEQNSVAIGKVYADDGVSGNKPMWQRPDGAKLMQDVKDGKIRNILILKLDRMGRNTRDYLNLKHELKRYGAHVVNITQPIPDTPAGRMFERQLAAFAEFDRETILENTWRGMLRKVSDGGSPGGYASFGYVTEGAGRTAKWVLHPDNWKVVLRMFEMYDEGKSVDDIADWLNEQGVPTSRQNPGSIWGGNSVLHVLRNRDYIGTRHWGASQRITTEDAKPRMVRTPERAVVIPVPVIVPLDLFNRVQRKLTANQNIRRGGAQIEYLLRDKIFCGVCGRKYQCAGRYYGCVARCSARRLFGKNSGKRCPGLLQHREHVDKLIWFWMQHYLDDPDALALEIAEQAASQPKQDNAREIAALERTLAKQSERRERVEDAFADGTLTKEAFNRQALRIQEATEPAQRKLAQLRSEQRTAAEAKVGLKQARSLLEKLSRKKYNFDERRRIVEALVDRIVVEPLKEGVPYAEHLSIGFRFHWESPLLTKWETRGNPTGVTAAEAEAGAASLLIASGASLSRTVRAGVSPESRSTGPSINL